MKKYRWKIPRIWRNGKKIRFVDYRINKEGVLKRIKNSKRWKAGKIIKGYVHPNGYVYVQPFVSGMQYLVPVHRLVWETFVGRVPRGHEVNHNNEKGDKTINWLSELECITHKKNIQHAKENGLNWTKEQNERRNEKMRGRVLSEEHKMKISRAMEGVNNPMHGRCGEKAPGSILSKKQVNEIRYLLYIVGMNGGEISEKFKVSKSCIFKIKLGYTWNPKKLSYEEIKNIRYGQEVLAVRGV